MEYNKNRPGGVRQEEKCSNAFNKVTIWSINLSELPSVLASTLHSQQELFGVDLNVRIASPNTF